MKELIVFSVTVMLLLCLAGKAYCYDFEANEVMPNIKVTISDIQQGSAYRAQCDGRVFNALTILQFDGYYYDGRDSFYTWVAYPYAPPEAAPPHLSTNYIVKYYYVWSDNGASPYWKHPRWFITCAQKSTTFACYQNWDWPLSFTCDFPEPFLNGINLLSSSLYHGGGFTAEFLDAGDFNGDGVADEKDFAMFSAHWMVKTKGSYNHIIDMEDFILYDHDRDGIVGAADLAYFGQHWLNLYKAKNYGDFNLDWKINFEDFALMANKWVSDYNSLDLKRFSDNWLKQ